MTPGYMTDGAGHSQNSQPESKRHVQQGDTNIGESRANTALPKPFHTKPKVPKNCTIYCFVLLSLCVVSLCSRLP